MSIHHPVDLDREAFSPYGEVFVPAATSGRLDHVATLDNRREAARPNLFMARTSLVSLPHRCDRMERHPWSSQSFAPFGEAPILIGVALPDAAGAPDLRSFKAFLARSQGFSYRAGVWHLPIGTLGETMPILGFMYEDGSPEDCVWADIAPLELA